MHADGRPLEELELLECGVACPGGAVAEMSRERHGELASSIVLRLWAELSDSAFLLAQTRSAEGTAHPPGWLSGLPARRRAGWRAHLPQAPPIPIFTVHDLARAVARIRRLNLLLERYRYDLRAK